MTYTRQHLDETVKITQALDANAIDRVVDLLADVRARDGRLFFLGAGGSAGNASYAVNDFRKLAASRPMPRRTTCRNSLHVGRDGGYTAMTAHACVIVPTVNPDSVTPRAEAFQTVVWHLLVAQSQLKAAPTKWESTR